LHSFLQRSRATSKENPAQHDVKNDGRFTGSSDFQPGLYLGFRDKVPQGPRKAFENARLRVGCTRRAGRAGGSARRMIAALQ